MDRTPREQLHHDIRNRFSTAIVAYYRAHPEEAEDEVKMKLAVDALQRLMLLVLEDVDKRWPPCGEVQ